MYNFNYHDDSFIDEMLWGKFILNKTIKDDMIKLGMDKDNSEKISSIVSLIAFG